MKIKLRNGSNEDHKVGLTGYRQAGTGSVDEIPSIQIIEPNERIDELRIEYEQPTSSRSPRMTNSKSRKMLPFGKKRRAKK